jgi:hypothetical protein
MTSLPVTFGLLHLATKRFARFDDVDRNVFHRLNKDLSGTTYRDEENELGDRAAFYETDELATILEIIGAELDSSGFGEIDDGYGELVILDDVSKFSPVAFIRSASRFFDVGDYIVDKLQVKLVVNYDEDGNNYELVDITA